MLVSNFIRQCLNVMFCLGIIKHDSVLLIQEQVLPNAPAKSTGYQPAVGFILPVAIEAQLLQGLWIGAQIYRPLVRAFAAVDHLVDLLEAIAQLQV